MKPGEVICSTDINKHKQDIQDAHNVHENDWYNGRVQGRADRVIHIEAAIMRILDINEPEDWKREIKLYFANQRLSYEI